MKLANKRKYLPIITVGLVMFTAFALAVPNQGIETATQNASKDIQQSKVPTVNKSADEEPSASTPQPKPPSASPSGQTQRAVPSCENIPIPRRTEYRDDRLMPAGESRKGHEGVDGFVLRCTEYDTRGVLISKEVANVSPVNNIIYRGTGKTAEQLLLEAELEEQRQAEERSRRDHSYNVRLAQCIQNLRAQGVHDSAYASSMCRQTVQY